MLQHYYNHQLNDKFTFFFKSILKQYSHVHMDINSVSGLRNCFFRQYWLKSDFNRRDGRLRFKSAALNVSNEVVFLQ